MEVHFSPDVQAKLEQMAQDSGCSTDEFLGDALNAHLVELEETRKMLDRRFDDLESGKVKLIPGEEVEAYFREKAAADRRLPQAS